MVMTSGTSSAQAAEAEARTMAGQGTNTPHRRYETPVRLEAVRAEALFASTLQRSQSASSDQVRVAVATALRRLGPGGCAAQVAGEFGDHPDTAAARMTWALAIIRTVYPTAPTVPAPTMLTLAPAS
jgi:hypothetical protein